MNMVSEDRSFKNMGGERHAEIEYTEEREVEDWRYVSVLLSELIGTTCSRKMVACTGERLDKSEFRTGICTEEGM